jgi:Carbohydrate binding domain/Glycosyl hydrolase family 26
MFRYKKDFSLVNSGVWIILATGLLAAGDASAANLLTNGSFESGLAPWTFTLGSGVQGTQYQDGTTHDDGNWSEAIQAWSPISAAPWGARLGQSGISLSAGQVVTVSFAAIATTTRPLSTGIQQTSGAWTWYHFQAFSLTPYWTTYTFSFTMPANDSNTSLNFEMGNMAGDVWIDNVSVTAASGATPAAVVAPSLALGDSPNFNYGNPLWDPDLTSLTQDGNEINRKFAFMLGFSAWASSGSYTTFGATQPGMDALHNAGYGIVLTWCAQDSEDSSTDPNYNYAAIISGQHDTYISQWARSAAAWGHVFYLRLFHEMNGTWYPWGINVNGNTPALAIQAWQHIYNIFQSAGATNVKFLWCPNAVTADYLTDAFSTFYPGDAYVSWLGMDGYNYGVYGEQMWEVPFSSFTQMFQYTYNEMFSTASSTKPVMVVETASAAGAGATDKANWITQMQNDVPTLFPNIQALAYYDYWDSDQPPDFWRFDADPFSLQAFTALAADSRWQGALQ